MRPVFLIFLGILFQNIASAAFQVLLIEGDVFLIDGGRQKELLFGEVFDFEGKQGYLDIRENSVIFLRQGDRCINIKGKGSYSLSEVDKLTFDCKLKFILKSILSVREILKRNYSRSLLFRDTGNLQKDVEFFFKQTIYNQGQQYQLKNYLIAAAFYETLEEYEKVSYLLGRVAKKDSFYKKLHEKSLLRTSQENVDRLVEQINQSYFNKIKDKHKYALLIGINDYPSPYWQSLKNPINDITRLKNVLVNQYDYIPTNILDVRNATFEMLISSFNKISELMKPSNGKAKLLVYYAGHGHYTASGEVGFWVPSDAGSPDLLKNFISSEVILDKIKSTTSRHTLLLADSCFSGRLIQEFRSSSPSKYYEELNRLPSKEIITSGDIEPVSDKAGNGHSVFNNALIKTLEKKRSEPLSSQELSIEIAKEISTTEYDQTPRYGKLGNSQDKGQFLFVRNGVEIKNRSSKYGNDRFNERVVYKDVNYLPHIITSGLFLGAYYLRSEEERKIENLRDENSDINRRAQETNDQNEFNSLRSEFNENKDEIDEREQNVENYNILGVLLLAFESYLIIDDALDILNEEEKGVSLSGIEFMYTQKQYGLKTQFRF